MAAEFFRLLFPSLVHSTRKMMSLLFSQDGCLVLHPHAPGPDTGRPARGSPTAVGERAEARKALGRLLLAVEPSTFVHAPTQALTR